LRRRATFLGATALLIALVATVPLATTASAQDSAVQLEQLNKQNRDLDGKIAAEDKTIGEADASIAALERDVQKSSVQLELTADEYARVVESRREPAHTRVAFAIDAYVRGDPLLTSIIEELLTLTSRSEDLTQRELYRAVVEDADNRLAAVDQQLRDLGKLAASQQAAGKGVRDQLAAAQEKRRVAAETRQKLAAERADVQRQIEEINARASRAVLTGTSSFEDQNRPALVVKIDNVDDARPQSGINQADVVFEEQVEGGLTRLAAVFHSRGSDPVGPIRSVRTTDVHLFSNLNGPLFVSSGGNAGTRAALLDSSLVDAGPTEYPDIYYRESRPAPHNYFSRTSDIWSSAAGKGGRPPSLFAFRATDAARPANTRDSAGVDVSFPAAKIGYTWNGTGWARTQNGRNHVDTAGVQVAPTNVIVQFTAYGRSPADENSPEAIVSGSGEAWIFTRGYYVRGTWTRKNDSAVTVYTDEQGNPITLTPGNTWIELPQAGGASLR
jgi:Protein of unknown function (DUF3048) N-terminal domain/Protein of unknown function (DUF3048) C-terminal domain